MKVIYITSSFDKKGSASIRNISLVNGLIENGVEVDVLTQKWPASMIDQDLSKYINPKVNIFYDDIKTINFYFSKLKNTGTTNSKTNTFINNMKKIIKYIVYFPDIDKEWIKTYNKVIDYSDYDLIISSSDTKTSHFVSKKIVNNLDNPLWYQIWGDPWVDDKGTKGLRKVIAYIYEKRLIKSGNLVFYVSKPTLTSMKKKYKNYASKMVYLGRSFLVKIESTKKNTGNYVFSYVGSLYYGRNIKELINAIEEYNNTHMKPIILNIYGNHDHEVEAIYKDYSFINFYDHVNYSEVIDITKESDVLIFLGNMKDSHQIPGKLFDYFGTNKTILAVMDSLDTDVSKFIKSTNRCLLFRNNKTEIDLERVISNVKCNNNEVLENYSSFHIANALLNKYKGE